MGLESYGFALVEEDPTKEYDEYREFNGRSLPVSEIMEWRNHNRLHGWMEKLWIKKGRPMSSEERQANPELEFNTIALELTLEDLDQLEEDIHSKSFPATDAPFKGLWGEDSYVDYKYENNDLQFVKDARSAYTQGKCVCVCFYSWG